MNGFYFWLYSIIKPLYLWLESQTEAARYAAERKAVILDAEQRLTAVRMRRVMGTQQTGTWPGIFTEKPCKHLKGGPNRSLSVKDHSVYLHTFIDGSHVIKCTICGQRWTKASPDWPEAVKMTEQSTNTRSSSEVVEQRKG